MIQLLLTVITTNKASMCIISRFLLSRYLLMIFWESFLNFSSLSTWKINKASAKLWLWRRSLEIRDSSGIQREFILFTVGLKFYFCEQLKLQVAMFASQLGSEIAVFIDFWATTVKSGILLKERKS